MARDPRDSSGSTPSSGRKRRAQTIDLSAEEVKRGAGTSAPAGAEETAGPQTDRPAAAAESDVPRPPEEPSAGDAAPDEKRAATPERPERKPEPEPERPMPSAFALPPRAGSPGEAPAPERGGARIGSMLAAALAGGLIALAGLFLLGLAGLLPLPGDRGEEAQGLRQQVTALEQQLAAARQAGDLERQDLQAQLADINQRVAELAEAAPAGPGAPDAGLGEEVAALQSALAEEVAGLQAALAELRDQVGGAAPPAALEDVEARLRDMDGLAERVAQLTEQVQGLQGGLPAEQDLSAIESDVASLRDQMARLEGALTQIGQQLQGAAPAEELRNIEAQLETLSRQAASAEALVPAVAAEGLASALADGRPFAAEIGAIQALGIEDPALAELAPYAESGLPTRAELRRRFEELRPQLIVRDEPPPDAGPLERLWQSARNVVDVRPAGPQQGGSPEAIASRIEAALQAGDLRRALEEWQDLPEFAQAESQDWAAEASALLAGESLAARLRTGALAELAPRG